MNAPSSAAPSTQVKPFPRVFWVAIGLELLERMAFYGVYINLAVYLIKTVGLSEVENGLLLGYFAMGRAWIPIVVGALADKLGFRRSLLTSFALYSLSYLSLFAFPSRPGAYFAVFAMCLAGAFLKPVIPGTVRRYSPEGREQTGFSIFYASVNAGSVVGKVLTKLVRTAISLRASMINSVVACVVALGITFAFFHEPKAKETGEQALKDAGPKAPSEGTLRALLNAAKNTRLVIFLLLVSGYYLLIEQFYQTFPVYIVRMFGESAPREYITLINPAAIAIFQLLVARLTRRLPPVFAMAFGILIGAGSMLLMGSFPTLAGACASFFVFALAEMVYSPRYYQYVSSFAPKGKEGLYMGLGLAPFGLGGLAGGVLSGRLIKQHLPEVGTRYPLRVWGSYAVIGVVCASMLAIYALWERRNPQASPPASSV